MEGEYERLLTEPRRRMLGIPVRKVVIQVVAGRNIAVLVEACRAQHHPATARDRHLSGVRRWHRRRAMEE